MKALLFRQKGAAEKVLEFGDTNIADILPDEVQVRVLASPINPADFMFIEKTYRVEPEYPQIAGFEGAGLIVENGGDNRFPINAMVAFRHKNVWAEFVNIPKQKIITLPKSMSVEKAAQLSLNPVTAWALLEESNADPGEWIILSAASSALSKLIIQLAKSRGLNTLAIIRKNNEHEHLLNLGASAVLYDNADDLDIQIKSLTGENRIASFLDAVGGELATKVIKVISVNSRIIHYGLFSKQNVTYHNADIIFKNIIIKGFGIDGWLQSKTVAEQETMWRELINELIKPDFKMEVSGKYRFDAYKNAIADCTSGKGGKVLFWMD
ncbi:MAG: zinc-binding dehydrogenase [Terrimonas sp.]|nr:zinc-binding dehydrogenase [Terrimonas sp.]